MKYSAFNKRTFNCVAYLHQYDGISEPSVVIDVAEKATWSELAAKKLAGTTGTGGRRRVVIAAL